MYLNFHAYRTKENIKKCFKKVCILKRSMTSIIAKEQAYILFLISLRQ